MNDHDRETPEQLSNEAPKLRRIGVTGGRDFADWNLVAKVVHALPYGVLVHGAASGADDLCAKWWTRMMGRPDEPHQADWGHCGESCYHPVRTAPDGSNYCPAAGPRRNQQMVDSGLDLLVAFPGGRGTADMVLRAGSAGVPVLHAAWGEWS